MLAGQVCPIEPSIAALARPQNSAHNSSTSPCQLALILDHILVNFLAQTFGIFYFEEFSPGENPGHLNPSNFPKTAFPTMSGRTNSFLPITSRIISETWFPSKFLGMSIRIFFLGRVSGTFQFGQFVWSWLSGHVNSESFSGAGFPDMSIWAIFLGWVFGTCQFG